MKRISILLSPLAAALVLLGACGQDSDQGARPERYSVRLTPINGSEVRATAVLSLSGERLTVDIQATGMEPERIHPQDLFGAVEADRAPRCPTANADLDADGVVGGEEAEDAYGASVRHLEPYPTVGADGELDYEVTSRIDPANVRPLGSRLLVLHGLDVGPTESGIADAYDPDVPVACGVLVRTGR